MNSSINYIDGRSGIAFDPNMVKPFEPFCRGEIIFGGAFGDEGKGKVVDYKVDKYKKEGYKVLSMRGQGSGNAGHTVKVDGKKYDFHYLPSGALAADLTLLGPGMLIDPIRMQTEAQQLPEEQRKKILISERATLVTQLDRLMDEWVENMRKGKGQEIIGTTKSGVGPCAGNRAYRTHVTFADALHCTNRDELTRLILGNPLWPDEIRHSLEPSYMKQLWEAIHEINVVDSLEVLNKCREERNWAVLLEVSQAVLLDPLFGNGGHFVTSTPCTDIGGAAFAGLTLKDFKDGSTMVLKAYGSKVGGGPYITKFQPEEAGIDKYIHQEVGEKGVTTNRLRDLGWFDAVGARHSIALTGADIHINCMDVVANFNLGVPTDTIKIVFAYQNIKTGAVTYSWPYFLSEYRPLFIELPIKGKSFEAVIMEYILAIEEVIGKKITSFGVGPEREDFCLRSDYLK